MAFKLNVSTTYKWPIKFAIVNEAGVQETHEFKGVFKRYSREDLITLNRTDDTDLSQRAPADIIAADVEYLGKFLVGWEGVTDEDGKDLSYCTGNLTKLLVAIPNINSSISNAFFESATGGKALKNL